MYDLIIIGAGPAGITAGIYAARQGLNALLIAKEFGGQIARKSVAIENYPGFKKISGSDLIQRFKEHLEEQRIEIRKGSVIKVTRAANNFLVFTDGKPSSVPVLEATQTQKKFQAEAVIIASGADPRPLEVPGEKEFIGRGVSYCALCDMPMFTNKAVAVIGGGNVGFEAARALANYAKKIYILEYSQRVKADRFNQQIAKNTGKVQIIVNAGLKEIRGKKFVNSIKYQNRKTNKEKTLPVSGVFIAAGSQPATSFVKDLVDFNERDEIKVDFETYQTKIPGLFAAGDVNMGRCKQIITAAGEGAKAALSAYAYLQSQRS